jgi:CheY-like chemotaxis protein
LRPAAATRTKRTTVTWHSGAPNRGYVRAVNLPGIRTLLVDDEPDIRMVMRLAIEAENAHVRVVGEVEDGPAAVAAVDDLSPECVVIDVRMPHLDGLMAAARILDRDSPPAVILCTAFVDRALEREATDLGVSACVAKTDLIDIPDVIRRVTRDGVVDDEVVIRLP